MVKLTVEGLKDHWFFKMMMSFFKKNGLYHKICRFCQSQATDKYFVPHICEMHAYNYTPIRLFFNTLLATFGAKWKNVFGDKYKLMDLEKKWSSFVIEHQELIPIQIKKNAIFLCDEDDSLINKKFDLFLKRRYNYIYDEDKYNVDEITKEL